jgi:hypothetical protein
MKKLFGMILLSTMTAFYSNASSKYNDIYYVSKAPTYLGFSLTGCHRDDRECNNLRDHYIEFIKEKIEEEEAAQAASKEAASKTRTFTLESSTNVCVTSDGDVDVNVSEDRRTITITQPDKK